MATAQAQKSDTTLQDYTIGWISALPIELAAAKEMMDEIHPNKPNAVAGDTNTYVLGRVGDHNVVLACLPSGSYGTNSAAVVASHMMRTFPNLRFGLMVGIGGGVPSKSHDVRLGDVVVSKPQGEFGGVIQIDLGKDTTQGFERTGMLNRPPDLLLTALAEMEAESVFNESGALPDILAGIRRRWPQKAEEISYDSAKDKLYEAGYNHPWGMDTCESCEECRLVERLERPGTDPVIHYGLIASGNQVQKNGPNRDRLWKEFGVLCFEMEAAGLMNHFPCIVIRGICDYADSHKNKRWQLYAAMVAAAYAKELLGKVTPTAVENADLANKICDRLLSDIDDRLDPLLNARQSKEDEKILDWLSKSAHREKHKNVHVERKGNAGQWFLDSQEFQEWLKLPKSTLFCPGKPGAGKTFVASRVIDELLFVHEKDRDTAVVYLYCEYARQSEQTSTSLVAALLRQLSAYKASLPAALRKLARECKFRQGEERLPTYSELNTTLIDVAQDYRRIFLVVDALDECSNEALLELVSSIQDFYGRAAVSLMLTSRNVPEVTQLLEWDIQLRIEASKEDIRMYLDTRIQEIAVLRKNSSLTKEVVEGITEGVDGMFLLAKLHFDTLSQAHTPGDIRRALRNFRSAPQGQSKLEKAYRNAIERIQQRDQDCAWAYKILTWVVYAIRPLSPWELQHALAIKPGKDSIDEDDFADPADVISLCAGLVTINEETNTVQLVHYTTKEFFENNRPEWMFKAHEKMAISCLTYLSFGEFAVTRPLNYAWNTSIILGVFSTRWAFFQYAYRNWGHHIKRCSDDSWKDFEELLLMFLGSKNHIIGACYTNEWMPGYSQNWRWSHYLASFGLSNIFEYIVKDHLGHSFTSSDIDYADSFTDTPLCVAIEYDSVDVVRFLLNLRSPCDVNINYSRYEWTAVGRAIEKGNYAIVKLFTELPADRLDLSAHPHPWYPEFSPLSLAVKNGFSDIVKLLIDLGPDRVDPNGGHDNCLTNPFQRAAENNDCNMMRLLLSSCPTIDPDAGGLQHQTPLMRAVNRGHSDAAKFLVDLGPEQVNGNARDSDGKTALHHAAYKGHAAIVEALGSLHVDRVDIDAQDAYGRTPLYLAAMRGHDAVVDALIRIDEGRVNFNQKIRHGEWTPLLEAVWKGHVKVVKSLCSLGPEKVDVNARMSDRGTALHLAIIKGSYEIAELLIGLGERVDFDIKDADGDTARSLAAFSRPEFVKLFPENTR